MFKRHADESVTLSHRARWVMWGIVFLASILSIGLHGWIRNERTAAEAALVAKRKQLDAAAAVSLQTVKDLIAIRSTDEFRPTLSELEQALNGGRPFALHPQQDLRGRTSYLWNDPASGREYRFTYDSLGHLTYGTSWVSGPLYPRALPAPSPLSMKIDSLWRSGVGAGGLAWCGGFLLFFFAGRYRSPLSELLVAIVVVWTIAGVFHPRNKISAQSILSNDMLVVAGLMLLASAIMFLGTRQRGRHRPNLRLCSKCEYDLTGNVSGVCPECGMEIPVRVRNYIA